jgi:hypothetical protein
MLCFRANKFYYARVYSIFVGSYTVPVFLLKLSHARQICHYQELWLKDVALSRFADTRDCPSSLVCAMLFVVIKPLIKLSMD